MGELSHLGKWANDGLSGIRGQRKMIQGETDALAVITIQKTRQRQGN